MLTLPTQNKSSALSDTEKSGKLSTPTGGGNETLRPNEGSMHEARTSNGDRPLVYRKRSDSLDSDTTAKVRRLLSFFGEGPLSLHMVANSY